MKRNERDPSVERLLDGFKTPSPPAGLRSRVLAGARARVAEGPSNDPWSRLWEHRGLRLSWAAAVLLLLAGHVLVTQRSIPIHATSNPGLLAEQRADPEFVDMLRHVRISEDVQPIVGLFAAAGLPADLETEGNHS